MADPSSAAIVETRSLRKEYGPTLAVQEVSFQVARGEVVGFLGPNGAGKSTTMKMLTGYLRPTAGSAWVGGVEVAEEPLRAQAQIGYLPENAPLYEDMMVLDFLRFIGEVRGLSKEQITTRLKLVCERCGLGSVLGKDISQLSKGYRQRVGLAQALLHDPDVLILDEPTSGLDPNQIVEIRSLISELGRDKTILLSTHILPEVQASCSRIIIISSGKLVADDSTEALMDGGSGAVVNVVVARPDGGAPDAAQVEQLLAGAPGVHSISSVSGEGGGTLGFQVRARGSEDPRAGLFQAAVSGGFVLLDMHRERASLEDTFRHLTKEDNAHG